MYCGSETPSQHSSAIPAAAALNLLNLNVFCFFFLQYNTVSFFSSLYFVNDNKKISLCIFHVIWISRTSLTDKPTILKW